MGNTVPAAVRSRLAAAYLKQTEVLMSRTEEQMDRQQLLDTPDPDPSNEKGMAALIGKGVQFKGSISYHGAIRIDGTLEGEVQTDGCLLVAAGAVVTANIHAGTVICKGTITGQVVARRKVRLKAPAVLHGSVTTPLLSVEEGVLFNGEIEMVRDDHLGLWEVSSTGPDIEHQPRASLER